MFNSANGPMKENSVRSGWEVGSGRVKEVSGKDQEVCKDKKWPHEQKSGHMKERQDEDEA